MIFSRYPTLIGVRADQGYLDGDDAYEWYMIVYNSLKEESTDDITEKAILMADGCENVDELPISQTVKMNKALAITPDKEMYDDVQFALNVSKLSSKISCAKPKADKKGKILLSPTTITTMRSQLNLGDVAEAFAWYYEDRIKQGLPAEKKNCIFTKGGYTTKDVETLILSNVLRIWDICITRNT